MHFQYYWGIHLRPDSYMDWFLSVVGAANRGLEYCTKSEVLRREAGIAAGGAREVSIVSTILTLTTGAGAW